MGPARGVDKAIKQLKQLLKPQGVNVDQIFDKITFDTNQRSFQIILATAGPAPTGHSMPQDFLLRSPQKVAAFALSKLGLNKRVFARNCKVERLTKDQAHLFFDSYHLLGDGGGAYYLGLNHNGTLVAAASFSKGRKMNRLPDDRRSFELVRFCCAAGVTVTGGLSKLVQHFCLLKNPGDIMTYVDRQISNGAAFTKIGFEVLNETPAQQFLVDRRANTSLPYDGNPFDKSSHYLRSNAGNLKLVYTP